MTADKKPGHQSVDTVLGSLPELPASCHGVSTLMMYAILDAVESEHLNETVAALAPTLH